MAQLLLDRSRSGHGTHACSIIMFCVMFLSFGCFVEATTHYVNSRSVAGKLFDGVTLQTDLTLAAIKEVISIKKTLDNMMTEGVLEQIQQDICSWLSTYGLTHSNCTDISDIDVLEDMLEMRESAVRSVQDEVRSFVEVPGEDRFDNKCGWVNHRVLDDCTTLTEFELTNQQNTTKIFFHNTTNRCSYRTGDDIEFNEDLYLCREV